MAQTDAGKPHSLIRAERLFAVLLALALWQLGAMFLGNSLLLVTPVQVAVRLFELLQEPDFYAVTGFSFARIVSGFLLGFVSGTLLAMLAGRWHWVEVLLWPYITVIKTTPVASFIILCLICNVQTCFSQFIAIGFCSCYQDFFIFVIFLQEISGISSGSDKFLFCSFNAPVMKLLYIISGCFG